MRPDLRGLSGGSTGQDWRYWGEHRDSSHCSIVSPIGFFLSQVVYWPMVWNLCLPGWSLFPPSQPSQGGYRPKGGAASVSMYMGEVRVNSSMSGPVSDSGRFPLTRAAILIAPLSCWFLAETEKHGWGRGPCRCSQCVRSQLASVPIN